MAKGFQKGKDPNRGNPNTHAKKAQLRENSRKGGDAKRDNAGERDHELEREGEPVEEHDTFTFMPRLSSISI